MHTACLVLQKGIELQEKAEISRDTTMKTFYKDLNLYFKHQNSSSRKTAWVRCHKLQSVTPDDIKPSPEALERQHLFTKAHSEVFGRLQAAFEVEKV